MCLNSENLQHCIHRRRSFGVKTSVGLSSSEHSDIVASNGVGVNIGEKTSDMVMPDLLSSSTPNFCHIF